MKFRMAGVLLMTLPLIAVAVTQNKPADQKLLQEFQKLQQDYYKALDKYYEPYQKAKTDEERRVVKLDPAKDPSKDFLPKFKAFALKVKGNQAVGPQAEATLIQMSSDKKDLKDSLDRLTKLYIKSEALENFLYAVGIACDKIHNWHSPASTKATTSILMEIESKSPHKGVKAAALFKRGEMLSSKYETESPDIPTATRIFQSVIGKYPGTKYAKQAEGAMFEMNNLQIGKVAPDFEATDENGVKWKLSDYRGKVVVVDFWGFW